ncbi:microsomal glutathione S-transferase 1-like [Ostrinia furnacalis]|uniref:microsomal glutathione S-transferase 1-like n=1 Tax=Ostrinia furnacalis TaxID=93504 RepID=UPI00103E0B07|nr:microsomal glutathione S-transferase 1-like [Ostrinia furnacalis]
MSKMSCALPCTDLMQSYFLYSAILALKLLALAPLASLVCNPEKIQRANLSDLKNLTPFWLVAALYMTTSPDHVTAIILLRVFVLARFVAALGYVKRLPKMAVEMAFFVSFAITSYMGGCVVYTYRAAL